MDKLLINVKLAILERIYNGASNKILTIINECVADLASQHGKCDQWQLRIKGLWLQSVNSNYMALRQQVTMGRTNIKGLTLDGSMREWHVAECVPNNVDEDCYILSPTPELINAMGIYDPVYDPFN